MGHRKSVQPPWSFSFDQAFIGFFRRLHCLFRSQGDDGIHFRIDPFDLLQVGFGDFNRRDLAPSQFCGQFRAS